jgi:pyruvate kinase
MTTQIIATIGKTFNHKSINAMFIAGANIFRYNFSHGNHKDALRLKSILNYTQFKNCKLIGDIAGPEVRLYNYNSNICIKKNNTLKIFSKETITDDIKINISLKDFSPISKQVILSDGLINAEIVEYNKTSFTLKIFNLYQVKLKPNAHIAFPGSDYPLEFLNDKDINDIRFCQYNQFDYIALSFVKSSSDILRVKELLNNSKISLIAKFELPQSIKSIDEIIKVADAFFIARGDLGNECGMLNIPYLQDLITQKCHTASKPVFLATQILESMIKNPNPTRAELIDIAYAIKNKISALTLSGETSYGKYPIQAITLLKDMINQYQT